jgi:hypothetical protein
VPRQHVRLVSFSYELSTHAWLVISTATFRFPALCAVETHFCQLYKPTCEYTDVDSKDTTSVPCQLEKAGHDNCTRHLHGQDLTISACTLAMTKSINRSYLYEVSAGCIYPLPKAKYGKCSFGRETTDMYLCTCRGDLCNQIVVPNTPEPLTDSVMPLSSSPTPSKG